MLAKVMLNDGPGGIDTNPQGKSLLFLFVVIDP